MAIQMAKLAGARVITTVGSDDKIPKAVILGADAVINHAREKVSERVKLLTEGRGVDVVIEHIGPEVWDSCLASLAKGGRLDYLWCDDRSRGQAGPPVPLFPAVHDQRFVHGDPRGTCESGGADGPGTA